MPTVIVRSRLRGDVTIDAPEGGRLLDLCDDARAPIRFSCRSATCGTCRVDVLEGEALLEDAGRDERELLAFFGDPPHRRLACVARARGGNGRVCVRPLDDDAV